MARNKRGSAFSRSLYSLRYRVGEYALRGFVASLPYVPYPWVLRFARFMAHVTYRTLWAYRRRMEANVGAVFGREVPSAKERADLVWGAWLNFTRTVVDTTAVMHFTKEQILEMVALEGEEFLQRALERGKGVLALSAHLGGFTLIGPRLAAGGYPFSVVVKQPADERFTRLVDGYRARIGIQTISAKPRREAVRGILRALRENRIVLVVSDEFKSGDVRVDFLGMKAPAPRGPATLALRTGAVTLPMFATRGADQRLTLTIGEAIEPVLRDDLESSVVATTELYTRHLEAAIRRFPEQWNWLGLPRQDGKMSRAEMARQRRDARTRPLAETAPADGIDSRRSSL